MEISEIKEPTLEDYVKEAGRLEDKIREYEIIITLTNSEEWNEIVKIMEDQFIKPIADGFWTVPAEKFALDRERAKGMQFVLYFKDLCPGLIAEAKQSLDNVKGIIEEITKSQKGKKE